MALTVGKEGSHHLILRDLPSGGSTEVGLVLEKDRNGNLRYVRDELTSFAERRSSGPLSYSDIHPGVALTHSQNDWSGGAMQAAYDPARPNMYAHADGMDMRGANVFTPGMLLNAAEGVSAIPNQDAEQNTTAHWTSSVGAGGGLTNVTTDPRSGSRHFHIVCATDGVVDTHTLQRLPPDGLKGVSVTWTVYAKWVSGTGSFKLRLTDSAGSTDETNAITSGDTAYTAHTVTRTIDSGATYVELQLRDQSANASTFHIDDMSITEPSDVTAVSTVQGMAVVGDVPYIITGGRIAKWDNTGTKWDTVYTSASLCTGIAEYNGNIYVGRGFGDNAYIYGTNVTWTESTIASDAKYAHHFAVSRATLWKSRHDAGSGTREFVNSSTNPVNGGSWGTEVAVGSSDRKITGLYKLNDTLVVGKEDGAHIYLRVYEDGTSAAIFENITQEFEHFVDSENFDRGVEFGGFLYLTAAQQSFRRWPGRGATMQDLTALFDSPRLTDFGGRIRAMAPAQSRLYLLLDTPVADSTSGKEVWLMSLEEDTDGLHVHTIEKVALGTISFMAAHNGKLWAMGHRNNSETEQVVTWYWTLPSKTRFPAFDVTPSLNTSAVVTMPKVDWNLPSEEKAFISIEVYLKDSIIDAEHTLVVKYTLDDGSQVTLATISSATGADHRELFFNTVTNPETAAVGNEIQVEFTATTDDGVPVEVYSYQINATYQPAALETFDVWVKIGENLSGPNAGVDPDSKATKMSALETLRDTTWPIEWEQDFDDDGTPEKIRGHMQRGTLRRTPEHETQAGIEVWAFRLIEVKVA